VFHRTGTTWQQEAHLKASHAGLGDRFGFSVALSGDTLAVGAWHEASALEALSPKDVVALELEIGVPIACQLTIEGIVLGKEIPR
jgi:hypothetical protein